MHPLIFDLGRVQLGPFDVPLRLPSYGAAMLLGMVLGWLPTTGVTLPLFSYGGSSLISTCAALGVVQSVWRHRLVNQ